MIIIDNDSKIIQEREFGFGQTPVKAYSSNQMYACHKTNIDAYEIHWFNGTVWSLDATFTDTAMDYGHIVVSELNDIFFCYLMCTATPTIKIKKKDHGTGLWSEVLSVVMSVNALSNYPIPFMYYSRWSPHRLCVTRIWADNTLHQECETRYSDDYGNTWSTTSFEITVASSTFLTYIMGIDTNPINGDVYILYRCYDTGTAKYHWRIRRLLFTFADQGVFYAGGSTMQPYCGAFVIDSAGTRWTFLNYYGGGGSNAEELHVFKNEVLSCDVAGGANVIYRGMLSISRDNGDNVYAFYILKSNGMVSYRKYVYLTSTWDSEQVLSTGQARRVGTEQNPFSTNPRVNLIYYTSV